MTTDTVATDRAIARVGSYEELVAAFRAQVQTLGINYAILDSAAGFAWGYSSKLFAHSEYCSSGARRTKRHFSTESFDAYLVALCLDLVVVENPAKVAKLKAFMEAKLLKRGAPLRAVGTVDPVVVKFSRGFMKKIACLGGRARARKLHAIASRKKHSSETYRRNALMRWHRASSATDPAT